MSPQRRQSEAAVEHALKVEVIVDSLDPRDVAAIAEQVGDEVIADIFQTEEDNPE